jgi:hypothetical protein
MYKFLFTTLFIILQIAATAQPVPMHPGHWSGDSLKTTFQVMDGREVLTLHRGTVWAKDVLFGDGIIEVDISVSPKKSLTGISFRGDQEQTCENIYLRVPLSGRDDAIQYAPFFHNEDYWQLYPEHQAKYVYPQTGWVHMKIMVKGNTARLFINEDTVPALVVNHLRTANRSGKIGLWCLSEQSFSNFSYTPLPASPFTAVPVRKETGLVTSYQLSQAFTIAKKTKTLVYPTDMSLRWDTVTTEEDGLLNIGKYRFKKTSGTFEQNSNDLVWIKIDLTSAEARTKKMDLDFTNRIWVFLNGQIIYHGDHSYRLKGSFYKGLIDKRFISDALFLPLQKGKNELMIGISSVANGWGLISKIE